MLAAWVTRLGPPSVVAVTQRPDPVPGPGEVLVAIRAAAVNFPDVLVIAGKYQVTAPVPFIPGSEFAGVVQSAGVPPQLVGRRVIGTTFTGAFAEQVAVPADAVRPVPAGLDDVHAAAFAVAYRTAYHAIVTVGAAREGQTMVVLGAAGGVGLASVDVGTALGIRVLAAASSADRVALACSRGATAGIDYSTEDLKQRVGELTDGRGADIVIDPVGGRYAEPALRALAWGGRFVCVGFAAGTIPCITLNLVLLTGIIVRGFEMRTLPRPAGAAVADGDRRLDELVRPGLRPYVSSIRPLAGPAEALEEVAGRRGPRKDRSRRGHARDPRPVIGNLKDARYLGLAGGDLNCARVPWPPAAGGRGAPGRPRRRAGQGREDRRDSSGAHRPGRTGSQRGRRRPATWPARPPLSSARHGGRLRFGSVRAARGNHSRRPRRCSSCRCTARG